MLLQCACYDRYYKSNKVSNNIKSLILSLNAAFEQYFNSKYLGKNHRETRAKDKSTYAKLSKSIKNTIKLGPILTLLFKCQKSCT
jgi:sulfur relay (sulfurtransferase) DsrC/TusE family protein